MLPRLRETKVRNYPTELLKIAAVSGQTISTSQSIGLALPVSFFQGFEYAGAGTLNGLLPTEGDQILEIALNVRGGLPGIRESPKQTGQGA